MLLFVFNLVNYLIIFLYSSALDIDTDKGSLPKSGLCPICKIHYDGLKIHFNSCKKKALGNSNLELDLNPASMINSTYICEVLGVKKNQSLNS